VDAPIFDAIEPEKLKQLVPMLAAFCGVLIFDDKAQFAALAKDLEALASHWLDLEKNRRCYASAGFRDTGRRMEIENGKLTLAFYCMEREVQK